MSTKHLHIISFDIPYPANYGGVIDVFYKIKALAESGIEIHLHCFEYGRTASKELEDICENVYYYKRKMSKQFLFSSIPFIARTRASEDLMQNLLQDDYPILFEGLHCCYHLADSRLKYRLKIVRSHNIEHDYYKNLAKVEKFFFKKKYFIAEAKKLEKFEQVYKKANIILAISQADSKTLNDKYTNTICVAPFHRNTNVDIIATAKGFCLYHGNLEVGENNEVALFLVNEIFSKTTIPLIIAGRNPSRELSKVVSLCNNIELKANKSTEEIDELIKTAQINILPTFQATGIKLKLIAALYNGKYCIVNSPMVSNTGLETLCVIKDTPAEMNAAVEDLIDRVFDEEDLNNRKEILLNNFSNKFNAEKIMELLKF